MRRPTRLLALLLLLIASAAGAQTLRQAPESDPALSAGTPDLSPGALRARVHSGDRAGVAAMLTAALAEDARPGENPWRERDLFAVFTDLHPAVDAFTQGWLAEAPDDPLAQTARGWQLYAQGWAWRGETTADRTWPERLDRMARLHDQAISLMRQAFTARPDLLPASDGILRLDQTVGSARDIPLVLEQVMATRPNRVSLMWGMMKLAPQWGGAQTQVDLLCARYAGKVQGAGLYDAAICAIDAAYFAQYWDGPRRDAARAALGRTDVDVLNYARLIDVLAGFGTRGARFAVLKRVKAQRDLTVQESIVWDGLVAEQRAAEWKGDLPNPKETADKLRHIQDFERDLTAEERALFDRALVQLEGGPAPLSDQAEEKKARLRQVGLTRVAADNAPLSPEAVSQYRFALLDLDAGQAGLTPQPYPAFDMEARLARVLAAFPDDPGTWAALASDIAGFGTKDMTDRDTLSFFEAAEPSYANAIAFGMGQAYYLSEAVSGKVYALIGHADLMHLADPPGLSAAGASRRDAVLICPMLRQVVLLAAACRNEGTAWQQFGPWPLRDPKVLAYLQSKRSACPLLTDPSGMAYSPVPVDLSAFATSPAP